MASDAEKIAAIRELCEMVIGEEAMTCGGEDGVAAAVLGILDGPIVERVSG